MSPALTLVPGIDAPFADVDDRPSGLVELRQLVLLRRDGHRQARESDGLRRVGGPGLADALRLGRVQVEHAGLERFRDQVTGVRGGPHARPAFALVTAAVLAVVVAGVPSLGAAEDQALGGALGAGLGGDGNGQINSLGRW